VIALVAVLSASTASAVQVTLPNIALGSPPSATDVAVGVADSTGILGVAVSFTYSAAVVTATQVSGTALTNGCTIVPSISTPGMVVITAACPSGLPSGQSGPLFNVHFNSVANGHSNLTFTMTDEVPNGCFLNEGTPSCQPQNGAIDVGPVVATPTASNTTTPVATATNTLPVATATNTLPVATATNTSPVNTATASATRTATVHGHECRRDDDRERHGDDHFHEHRRPLADAERDAYDDRDGHAVADRHHDEHAGQHQHHDRDAHRVADADPDANTHGHADADDHQHAERHGDAGGDPGGAVSGEPGGRPDGHRSRRRPGVGAPPRRQALIVAARSGAHRAHPSRRHLAAVTPMRYLRMA
jgi:hypothetical protein